MLNNEIAFVNGKSSRDFGVFLIDGNIFDYPTREVEYLDVPGRSGSLTIDKGRWNNIDITYTFAAYDKDAPTKLNAWKEYLLANQGYQKIETSVESDIYRQGVLKSASSPQISMVGGGGYVEVTFSCMPQKWLKYDDTDLIVLSNGLQIYNPTNFDARPLLQVKASQSGGGITFLNYLFDRAASEYTYIGIGQLQINTTDNIWIDCDTGDAYSGSDNYNSKVAVFHDFPMILGQSKASQYSNPFSRSNTDRESLTVIQIDNTVTAKMYPRWWTL